MLHTVSAGMYQQQSVDKVGSVEMMANDPLIAAQTQNFIPDVTNLTQVQSGYQNVSNEDAMQKSFTVFEEVDHSKKSMIQFLTKVGSIQNLQQNTMATHEYTRMLNDVSPHRATGPQCVLSASMSPFIANQAM